MPVKLCLIGLLLCLSFESISQNIRRADSLISILENEHLTESEKVRIALHIAHNHPNSITSLAYAQNALEQAQSIGNIELQARLYEEIGSIQRIMGNNLESTQASLQALKLFEEIGRKDLGTAVLVQLGNNAVTDEDYLQAIDYFNQALKTYEASQEGLYMALTHLNMGEAYRLNNSLDSAVFNFRQSLRINDTLNHSGIESYALGNLGMAYNSQGELSAARKALNKSLKLVNELGDPYTHSVYLADLALIEQKEGNWSEAEDGYGKALQIARENGLKEQIRDISKMLVNFYKLKGDLEKALSYQELFQVYQDSLVNKENVQKLERLKSNHEINRKKAEIAQLTEKDQRRKRQIFAAMSIAAILIALSLLLYRSNQEKQKANLTLTAQKEVIRTREAEKALLLKELNHRVKNNLQMISSLLNLQGNELKGHPAEAAIAAGKFRVDALALIHQKLYRDDIHTTIVFKDYIEELVLNLCFSFGNRIKPRLNIESISLSIDQAIPLALIVNELVTNALKYAYQDTEDPDLQVSITTTKEFLQLSVSDNGAGMPVKVSKSNSFGLKLVQSLISQLEAQVTWPKQQQSEWKISVPFAPMENTNTLT